ncbi:hypothetical protein OM416_16985 [Paenibacillus sp. LS1]|uniref:hypothetical protein n=1 Tax=Paenibacillus sp. LS1 TaxID=2992120 RepID=UPI0022302ECA|nr:hypothetical protein [Paenibacillus sp. LS1]MCW3793289.1 hypothetical protein [Paenibacillus sp. LS1]
MFKKITSMLLVLSFLVVFGGQSFVSAATTNIDGAVSNMTVKKLSNNSYVLSFNLKRKLSSGESILISGDYPLQYRQNGFFNYTIDSTKSIGNYTIPISRSILPSRIYFTAQYKAPLLNYTESKKIAEHVNGFPEISEQFHTVTASEAGAAWISINIMPGLVIQFTKLNKTVKFFASAAYTMLMQLDGFTDALRVNTVWKPTAGEYVRSVTTFSATGTQNLKVEVYTDKLSYSKNIPPIYNFSVTIPLPK